MAKRMNIATLIRLVPGLVALVTLDLALAGDKVDSDLARHYEGHRWTELGVALERGGGPALYRGATSAVFNDPRAEAQLWSLIGASPRDEAAYEAYEWLSHLYLRNGHYRRFVDVMEKRWAAFPGRGAEKDERSTMAIFRGLPDQAVAVSGVSTLRHDGSTFLPLSVEGGEARFFFDTGAWLSCMSESEAKRLGLTVRAAEGTLGTSTGAGVGLRLAVARQVTVGGTRFENVSFAVFPDEQEPWSVLPQGQRGILGMPILLGLRRLRWSHDGAVSTGLEPGALDVGRANLFFDDDHLLAAVRFPKERVLVTLDTGAETTDLYEDFARRFAALLDKSGQKETKEVRGVGNAETFEAVRVPELRFEIGGFDTALRPAHVLLKSIGTKHAVGNLGLDLLRQAHSMEIDFGAMTLTLEPKPPGDSSKPVPSGKP